MSGGARSAAGAAGPGRPAEQPWGPYATPYEAVGGDEQVRALAERFYDRVETDSPLVRGLHPPDLAESREKLYEFLSGWLGGPPLYMEKHGHPRLRMRHMPFAIDQRGVDEWLACMEGAMDDVGLRGPVRAFLSGRFAHTANFMRNR